MSATNAPPSRYAGGEAGWAPWTAAERESFFDAIARHRRASWRITFVCVFAIAALVLVLSVLLAPLLVCLIGLAVDLVNLIVPLPDVLAAAGRVVDRLTSDRTFSLGMLLRATAVAAVPGLALLGLAVFALHRALRRAPLFDAGDVRGRAPSRSVLAEQRLANVAEEMALAAGVPPPKVVIIPGGINAAVFGRDEAHATLLVGEGLLCLDRAQMQGAIAHLVGSAAGGDLPIGLRAAVTFTLFSLMTRFMACFSDRREIYRVGRLLRTLVWPTRAGAAHLVEELADPFRSPEEEDRRASQGKEAGSKENALTWREWAMMPLVGPLVMSGFIAGLVSTFLLNPMVSLAWRQRKVMADAAAVRLTRDPDTLASALRVMMERGGTGLAPWAIHMAIAPGGSTGRQGLLGGQIVSIFPSLERRYLALGKLGATLDPRALRKRAYPVAVTVVIGALASLVGAMMTFVVALSIWLSAALSGLFTILPAALLHALLRAIGR